MSESLYFNNLIHCLHRNISSDTLLSVIINPFSLYYVCDHYYGTETFTYNIPIPKNIHNLLATGDVLRIKPFDIIHCQVNYFEQFCNSILPLITTKIILTTGQWHLPQLQKSKYTEQILHNDTIVCWFSQNPIYDISDKYKSFPYGICHSNLKPYAHALMNKEVPKTKNILFLPINNKTNVCRNNLPELPLLPPEQYYTQMVTGHFVISPIGDRHDCYRHYEAIGLGVIPISNVSDTYKHIFDDNMVYGDIDKLVFFGQNTDTILSYHIPNKNLICLEYYKDIINNIKETFLTKNK